ncbi:glycoside hydrolase family 28 protein [Rhodothermus marinus]|uniref:Glycoside hydrolase family 28 n=1 Tax=Rhodothermus marinus (strain ATCC 43812 / DSM 4252 / R-10) TaxID=518766 RepID=D0MEP1_RHOM4|nr:glycoside hydrolase family 28 protein [Rhodothermus marinus]ACY49269.1 glycoside hydrolase family 28 [Rhodothermus marinus DSM 4252]AEN74283.1 Polygalacturonase [Rhodothermus marinus SG0.5JP17-172]MBO2490736.1 glycoside hydrolase family 28 protein [Rhodothermus marinus]
MKIETRLPRRRFLELAAAGTGGLLLWPGRLLDGPEGWALVPEILAHIRPPVFPERDFVLTRYGAVGDGRTDCTDAFRQAIEACHRAGGGRVVVPRGTFLTGPIHLASNVNLHLDDGATVRFKQDPAAYLPVVFTRWEGVEGMNYSPFIYAFGQENVAITGSGVLDGQADENHWWPWKGRKEYGWREGMPTQDEARRRLFEMAEAGVPPEQRILGEGSYLRPNFIQFYRCRNVLIEGVTIVNSPMWEIHPVLCENVTVRGVTVRSHGPNNDGCNPESCRYVLIEDCLFDTGDDCIAIKSGRNADGRRVNVPSAYIVIRNCKMRDGHGGVVIGSEISGGAHHIYAERCEMSSPNLDRALRIKTNSVRGGLIEHIYMREVEVGQVADAVIRVNFYYEEGDAGPFDPIVRHIEVRNLTSRQSPYALYLRGYARSPIRDVRLIDCTFDGVEKNLTEHVDGLYLQNVRINGKRIDS